MPQARQFPQAKPAGAMRLVVAALGALAAGAAWSGVDLQTTKVPGPQKFHAEGSFQLECWQAGRRVIFQAGLQAMTVGPALSGSTISFRGSSPGGASVVLIPFEHSLCMTVSE